MTLQTMLPGFGRPVNYIPRKEDPDYIGKLWPHGLSGKDFEDGRTAMSILTLKEIAMIQLMNAITDKVDWNVKINDVNIARKWKEEALASGLDIEENMVDWCLDELRYKASLIPPAPLPAPPIIAFNGDVVKSDNALSPEFKTALQEAVFDFEERIPENMKDWHPGSDGKVWDLVHPSLFPVVYGTTRVLENGETTTLDDCIERCGEGKVMEVPPEKDVQELGGLNSESKCIFSQKFQWLPCDVSLENGETKIKSYINNLHPLKERALYPLIETLIDASIPLWNMSVAPIQDRRFFHPHRIDYKVTYDPDPENGPETDGPQQEEGEDEDDYIQRREAWYETERKLVMPKLEKKFSPVYLASPPTLNLREQYGSRGLQVIVKLANIELTSEKPEYNGGTWHIEGQMNEHIVASSIYYYSCSNITDSFLSFRQPFTYNQVLDLNGRQDVHDWYLPVYGCKNGELAAQAVGSVKTCEGRLVTFPNVLHHRVEPFKLADPSRPGHRKIVALFLVDPNIRVISSANVPCQRQDWWWDAAQTTNKDAAGRVFEFPRELQDLILKEVDYPICMEEAKTLREELMEERKEFKQFWEEPWNEFSVSLCEH